jgi:mRNA interferase MazF
VRSGTLPRGSIVLALVPFTDLSGAKLRPAVVVSSRSVAGDVIIAGITSVARPTPPPTDLFVPATHPEYPLTGFRVASVIRLHRLVTVEHGVLVRHLGRLGPVLQAEVDARLRLALGL